MDKPKAYAILQIKPGSSQEEIREAYVALSRQYHPEEHPEEFQQIHEAYMTLRRRERGQRTRQQQSTDQQELADTAKIHIEDVDKRNTVKEEQIPTDAAESADFHVEGETVSQTDEPVQAGSEWKEYSEPEESVESEASPRYDFDEVLEESQRQEVQRQIDLIRKALVEMEMLLKPPFCNKQKMFQEYFQKAEYQDALKQPAFMEKFAELLEDTRLKPMTYDYIIEYYRFRGLNPEDMYEEAAKLYYVLDEKRGMKKKNLGAVKTIVAVGAVAGIRAGTRSAHGNVGGFLVVLLVVIALIYFLYRQLYKNHSSLFAQAIVALLLTVSQFVVLMGSLYAPLMGTDAGDVLAVFLFLMGGVWLIGVAIAAVVKKLLSLRHRNRQVR